MEETENDGKLAIPIGLAMSMAQTPGAAESFSALPHRDKTELIAKARAARSRGEMETLVKSLSKGR